MKTAFIYTNMHHHEIPDMREQGYQLEEPSENPLSCYLEASKVDIVVLCGCTETPHVMIDDLHRRFKEGAAPKSIFDKAVVVLCKVTQETTQWYRERGLKYFVSCEDNSLPDAVRMILSRN